MTQIEESNLKNELETNINAHKNQNDNDWQKLVSYDMDKGQLITLQPTANKELTNIRQDNVPNGVKSEYTFDELTHQFSTSSKFNAHKFYDYNQYLPRLQLVAQTVDDEFHKSIQKIFNIDKDTQRATIKIIDNTNDDMKYNDNINAERSIGYSRGPVKLMVRARNKAENDYFDQQYPTTSCVLDFNRCTLVFDQIDALLFALNLFYKKINYYQSGNIIGVVRCKNGFKEYVKETQYSDIKLNVLIKGEKNNIIGEVQFLLNDFLNFKNRNHSLYSIQREEEFIRNSISKILPSLLDYKKQILIASRRGDIDIFRNLMVHSNKTDKDLMIYDNSNDSILCAICTKSYVKVFKYLQTVVGKDLFVKHLVGGKGGICAAINYDQLSIIEEICKNDYIFISDKNNINGLEYVITCNRVNLMKYIMAFKDIKEKCLNNKEILWRIVWWMGCIYRHKSMVKYLMSELELNESKLKELQSYKCPKSFVHNDTEKTISNDDINKILNATT